MRSERSSSDITREAVEEFTLSDLKQVVGNDISIVKRNHQKTVDSIKANINKLVSYVERVNIASCSSHSEINDERVLARRVSEFVGGSLVELHRKTILDLQFVQLYDQYIAKEAALKFKNDCVEKYFCLMKDKVVSDFQKLNKDTEETVKSTKLKLEEFIGINSEGKPVSLNLEKLKDEALTTFHQSSVRAEKDIFNTKMQIKDNVAVFLTNPNGPKTHEELESEKFIENHILDFKEKVEEDLMASKEITEKIAERTKQAIENFVLRDDDKPLSMKNNTFAFTLDNFQQQTTRNFTETDSKMKERITDLKESFQNTLQDTNTLATVTPQTEKMKIDFQVVDEKIKEESKDLKLMVAESVKCMAQRLNKE